MEITGKTTGIKYKILFSDDLNTIDIKAFSTNESPAFCLVKDDVNSEVNSVKMKSKAVLNLTSAKYDKNSHSQKQLIQMLFKEANENGVMVQIGKI